MVLFQEYPSRFTFHVSRAPMALDLLKSSPRNREMTRAQWLLLGALGLGLAIVIYFIFLCPTDCQ